MSSGSSRRARVPMDNHGGPGRKDNSSIQRGTWLKDVSTALSPFTGPSPMSHPKGKCAQLDTLPQRRSGHSDSPCIGSGAGSARTRCHMVPADCRRPQAVAYVVGIADPRKPPPTRAATRCWSSRWSKQAWPGSRNTPTARSAWNSNQRWVPVTDPRADPARRPRYGRRRARRSPSRTHDLRSS